MHHNDMMPKDPFDSVIREALFPGNGARFANRSASPAGFERTNYRDSQLPARQERVKGRPECFSQAIAYALHSATVSVLVPA
jgi:hypothetical protein